MEFYFPDISFTWEGLPFAQGSDHCPYVIRMWGSQSSIKRDFEVVRWDFFCFLVLRDSLLVTDRILANLKAAMSHIILRADSPEPDLKQANPFAAGRPAQRRHRRHRRREDRALSIRFKFKFLIPSL